MPFERFRFAHASNVRLDGVLRDIGPVPDDLRDTLRDATLTAFENVITTCLDREVVFLVLAGNTFDAHDTSLRARAAFRDGLECLDEAGIETIIIPGDEDPIEFWSRFGSLPASVTVLGLDKATESIRHRGEIVATVAEGFTGRSRSHSRVDDAHGGATPYRVLAAHGFDPEQDDVRAEYIALAGAGGRRTLSTSNPVVHHAGYVESRSAADAGLGGMSLVDVAPNGETRINFVATGVLRRERCNIDFGHDETAEHAAEKLVRCLTDGDAHPHVWLVDWQIGRGDDWLRSRRDDLEMQFEMHWDEAGEGRVLHRWTNVAADPIAGDDPLHDELRAQIRQHASADVGDLLHRVAATTERSPAIGDLVHRLGRDVNRDGIITRAEALADEWLRRAIEGGHAA